MKKIISIFVFSLLLLTFLIPALVSAEGENVFTIEEIVVIASRYPEKLKDVPVSVELIDREELNNMDAVSIAEVLNNKSGIFINNYGSVSAQKTVSIRGSMSRQVLVLVDGQVLNSHQNGVADLSMINTDQIERIEILKGPASALYGANALGGVLNIITKDGSKKPLFNLKYSMGSFNTGMTSFSFSGSQDKITYNTVFTTTKSDGYRDHSESKHDNLFMKFSYELENNTDLNVSFHNNKKDINTPGSTAWPTPNASQQDDDTIINVQWQKSCESIDTELGFYFNKHKNVYDDPDSFTHSEHKTDKINLNGKRTQYMGDHTFTYGFDVSKNKIDSTNNNQHEIMKEAVYLNDNYKLNDKVKLSLGGRLDNHELFGTEISPMVGSVIKLSPVLNLKVSYGKAYSTPTFNDLYFVGPFGQGNTDLKPESSNAYELGFNYNGELFNGEFAYFNRKTSDLIEWADPDLDFVWEPYNLDSASTNGFELNLTKELNDEITLSFNHTYLDSTDDDSGDQLAAKNDIVAALNYQKENFMASLNAKFLKDRPDNMEDYQVLNLRLASQVELAGREVELSFKVNNLTDEEYQVLNGYPMPERNYMFEFSTDI